MLVAMSALDSFDQLARVRRTSLKVDSRRPRPGRARRAAHRGGDARPEPQADLAVAVRRAHGPARERLGQLVSAFEARTRRGRGACRQGAWASTSGRPSWCWSERPAEADPVRRREDRDAVAAAVQNLLLGATAVGPRQPLGHRRLDGRPRTSRSWPGLAPDDDLVALVYLGWPNGEVPAVERPAPSILWLDA